MSKGSVFMSEVQDTGICYPDPSLVLYFYFSFNLGFFRRPLLLKLALSDKGTIWSNTLILYVLKNVFLTDIHLFT